MADWLEFRALSSRDKNSSASELRRLLVSIGGDDGIPTRTGGTTDDETLVASAFVEMEDRARSSLNGYPFDIVGPLVKVKPDVADCWSYIFCLLLSLKGADRADVPDQPTSLFEEVAEVAARNYVSGDSAKFGFPRRVLPTNFVAALDELCHRIGEGKGGKKRPEAYEAKDARLDIVAWRPFPDRRPAKLILFGQCAAGANFRDKLTDLQPRCFVDLFLNEHFQVEPIRAFFTPFRLPTDGWEVNARYGGIVFDRCRISHFAHAQPTPPGVVHWTKRTAAELKK